MIIVIMVIRIMMIMIIIMITIIIIIRLCNEVIRMHRIVVEMDVL